MKDFALIGAAGYIAPRHMKAIRDTGNRLVAAVDPHDNVGIIDSYFPDAMFFTEIERFDRHLEKLRRTNEPVDFVSVCTPNYLHDAHVRLALRLQASAICEKPLVINPWNLDQLAELEAESRGRIYTILQLRLLPDLVALRDRVAASSERYDVELTYVTRRGRWYDASWKGDQAKSGGVAMNIGIHFFDLLRWTFGELHECQVHHASGRRMAGWLAFERADVRWLLSIDGEDLPAAVTATGGYAFRSMKALACGTPVTAANVGGIPEQHCKKRYGLVFDPQDPSDIAEKTSAVLNRTWNREDLAARGTEFSREGTADFPVSFYERMLSRFGQGVQPS